MTSAAVASGLPRLFLRHPIGYRLWAPGDRMSSTVDRRQVAVLAHVTRRVLEEIRAAGGPVEAAHWDALALVDAYVAGERVAKRRLNEAQARVAEVSARYSVFSPDLEKAVYWVGHPLGKLCYVIATGKDLTKQVLTEAGYALPGGDDYVARKARLDALHAEAVAKCAAVSLEPLAMSPKRQSARVAAAEREALSASLAALSPLGARMLEVVGARRDPRRMGTAEQLAQLCKRRKFVAHEPALRFEELFGGLLVPTSPDVLWRDEGSYTLIGPLACLRALGADPPRGGPANEGAQLIPVALGPNDDVYFVDAAGRGCALDTLGEHDAVPWTTDGASLVLLLAIQAVLYYGVGPAERVVDVAEARGEEIARALRLEAVSGSDASWRTWAGAEAVVLQSERTRAVALSKDAAARLDAVIGA